MGVRVSFWNEWPGPILGGALAAHAPQILAIVAHVLLVCLATWFVILLVKLKPFIWNVYQTVLLSIAHEAGKRQGPDQPIG
jgi:hypothetical protein